MRRKLALTAALAAAVALMPTGWKITQHNHATAGGGWTWDGWTWDSTGKGHH